MSTANATLRAYLKAGFTAVPYVVVQNNNPKASDRPDAWVTMDFPGGKEESASIGTPGANRFRVDAVAQVHIFVKAGTGEDLADEYAEQVATLFRGKTIPISGSPTRYIHVDGIDPPVSGDGSADGRFFRITVAFDFRYDNFG